MNKAYVDTTILADVLLKPGGRGATAKAALKRYAHTELPVYAIKEFKAGPLKNVVWLHNKLATLGSFAKAVDAVQRMATTPRRYTTSTALEALAEASQSLGRQTSKALLEKYGNESVDNVLCDEYRLLLKTAILKAWKRRRSVTTGVVDPLPCYREDPPYEERGCIVLDPVQCSMESECSLSERLKALGSDLRKVREAVERQPDKPENRRRSQALRQLYRKPKMAMTEENCRALGDAYFVFFCPQDAVILTTNTKDFVALAQTLGKEVEGP